MASTPKIKSMHSAAGAIGIDNLLAPNAQMMAKQDTYVKVIICTGNVGATIVLPGKTKHLVIDLRRSANTRFIQAGLTVQERYIM
jgi:hypothetical protein